MHETPVPRGFRCLRGVVVLSTQGERARTGASRSVALNGAEVALDGGEDGGEHGLGGGEHFVAFTGPFRCPRRQQAQQTQAISAQTRRNSTTAPKILGLPDAAWINPPIEQPADPEQETQKAAA